ncbi:unnamed protein product [Cylindrotheca closterium]|uniref:Beta-lactamase-related domain-containing protein n=1 Tax=Cylindrotheca closterium TaxID=2856 RepID=A0AAD2PU76_9STRA|nr:unnamed protein product [Cylindrotheca closterium]
MGLRSRFRSRNKSGGASTSGDISTASSDSASPTHSPPSPSQAKLIAKFMEQHQKQGANKMPSKQQLRAYSFLKRTMSSGGFSAADAANGGDGLQQQEQQQQQQQQQQERMMEVLEANVQRLTEKCEALESQNILVAVQQLDFLARSIAWALTIAVLYLYWRCIGWGLEHYLHLSEQIQEQLLPAQQLDDRQAKLGNLLFGAVQMLFLAIPYLYNKRTHGSMKRRFEVFSIAFIIIGRIKLCRWREAVFVQHEGSNDNHNNNNNSNGHFSTIPRYGESCTENGIWEANYEISARFLYLSILRLRGLWTKTAQYLSSRADFVPVSYIRELSKLQDQTQSTPWSQVQPLLPANLLERLAHIEETPIASASIGQVHIAYLKDSNGNRGEKVVVKVQHPHARTLMTDDFWSLNVLCRIIGWMEPDYAFMEILMREWATEARKELDFNFEAENMFEANSELRSLFPTSTDVIYTAAAAAAASNNNNDNDKSNQKLTPFQVVVPTPMKDLCNRDVLVMDFCEGCRVDDFHQIDEWGLSRSAIMDGISQAFAHFMYCCTIFNGDPHPGNILVRPGTQQNDKEGFTLILLDWGLAKRLPTQKRIAFCQMVYAAATFDYGLLLDSYTTVGLKMKREDAGQSMEDMRFFLRDMAPREETRKRIKKKMKADKQRFKDNNEKVPMESKAYPGEFFFFIRVNELLHGLGGKYSINLGYLDALKPYAERGLRASSFYDLTALAPPSKPLKVANMHLQTKLENLLAKMSSEQSVVGGQVCVLDKGGSTEASVVEGNLGGLRSHIPMTRNSVVLGYSCTKAITATLAHLMVQEGFLEYDEPICKQVWPDFCPTADPPKNLATELGLSEDEVQKRWQWKRQITLRHLLDHTSGLWSLLPAKLTIKKMVSCEDTFASYAFNPDKPQETLLPTSEPGEKCQYHYLSFGWLVAGTLCGAYALKKNQDSVTFQEIYQDLLEPKLSQRTRDAGFYPMGGHGNHIPAQTATSDFRASTMMQRRREAEIMNSDNKSEQNPMMKVLEDFKGKEFLLDPRIWNSQDVLKANVPAAGGRFSAEGLASFFHDLSHGNILKSDVLSSVLSNVSKPTTAGNELQGVTRIANDISATNTHLSFGYQRIRTDRDPVDKFSCLGHAGVGGSIGFWHIKTGLCVSIMLNKSDGDLEVTKQILTLVADHYRI